MNGKQLYGRAIKMNYASQRTRNQNDNNMNKLPKSALELYSNQAKEKYPESTTEKGPWKITMDIPSYLPMILHYPGGI